MRHTKENVLSNETPQRLTKNERRNQAREQARIAREAEKKREKRNRLFIQGGVVLGVLAVLAIVGLVLTQSLKPAGPGPMNMSSGGVVFTKDLKVVEGERLEDPAAPRIAPAVDRGELPIDMTVYVDYSCLYCGDFEQRHGTMLENHVGSGDVQLEIYPINFLDNNSLGTKYSTRAANLLACVVNEQPEFAFDLHNRLLTPAVQSAGVAGVSDKELLQEAVAVGAEPTSELQSCVRDREFAAFIDANREAAFDGIVGLEEGAQLIASSDPQTGAVTSLQPEGEPQQLTSTPLVIVNGQQWHEPRDGTLESYILKLKGEIEQTNAGSADSESEEKSG